MAAVIKKELDSVEGYGREFASATVCCFDKMAARFVQEFVKLGYDVSVVEVDADGFSDYEKEYYVTVDNENKLFAEKAYRTNSWGDGYIIDEPELAYIHESCSSEILNKIDTMFLTEFSIREFGDDEYEDNDCTVGVDISKCDDRGGYLYSYSYPDEDFGRINISVFAERELPKSKLLEILTRL